MFFTVFLETLETPTVQCNATCKALSKRIRVLDRRSIFPSLLTLRTGKHILVNVERNYNTMDYRINPENGSLIISIEADEVAYITENYQDESDPQWMDRDERMYDVFHEELFCNCELEWADGDWALTSAPMVCIKNEKDQVTSLWGFMDYQVISMLGTLLREGEVTLQGGAIEEEINS